MGLEVPHRRGRLAPGLEPCDYIFRIPAAYSPGDLHDERQLFKQAEPLLFRPLTLLKAAPGYWRLAV